MRKFKPFLEDVSLEYANEHPQFYRNKAREEKWGEPVYFVPSTHAYDVTGTSGPYYKYGHNATEKLGKYGNCTWFCLGRHHENSGEVLSAIIGDAGKTFDKYTGRKEGSLTEKINIGNSIQDGDMLVFADNLENKGCGHIIYVEQVDDNIIHVSESGYSTKSCYEDKTCITYTLNKEDLVTSTKVSLRPIQPYSEYLYGVIHTGDCYKEKKKMFTRRYSKPTSKDKSYVLKADGGWNDCVVGSPTDSECRSLSNCVGYASGRFNEIYNELTGKSGCNYPYLNCNAENFIERVKQKYPEIEISDVAKVGAIMCWRKGKAGVSSDGAGHVAIVEEILERDDNGFPISVKTSESSYGGTAFYNAVRNYNNGNWVNWKNYYFRGFIYNPAVNVDLPVPVERNKYVDQLEVTSTCLRVRTEPSLSGTTIGMALPGYYNIIDQEKEDDYLWCEIESGKWCAVVEDASRILPKEEKWKEPEPVERDEKKQQIYIPDIALRIRKEPTTDSTQMGICVRESYYNVLEISVKEDYTWYRIGTDAWCAGVADVIFYDVEDSSKVKELKEQISQLKEENKQLKDDLKVANSKLAKVKEDLTKICESI